MQAIILAAGMGKRLGGLTRDNTKCMVRVNGTTLIERMLGQLDRFSLSRIVIVVGYHKERLVDFIHELDVRTPICFIDNPIYDRTNNIYSLSLASSYLQEDDTLLLESDLILDDSVLDSLIADPRESLALVDRYESWMDGTCLTVGVDDMITGVVSKADFCYSDTDRYYKTVNVYKFGSHFSRSIYVPFLKAYVEALGNNEYYEQVLRVITVLDKPEIKALRLQPEQRWYEIDDIQDLDIASTLFEPNPYVRFAMLNNRHGGYWRYPHLLDFGLLVNPYFPTERLGEELSANAHALITSYPSGMEVNALLAAKNFKVRAEHIVVGNGAAELIKSLMEALQGTVGMIRPMFEEYPARACGDVVEFLPPGGLSYTPDDIMAYYSDRSIRSLVLVNPDNPSGHYIARSEVLRLACWCGARDVRLIVDESFVDFADEEGASLIDEGTLAASPCLIVVKSISKSHGVPGLRLGVLASSDEKLISAIKQDVAIWNINSFAEFYLQIFGKYESAYVEALDKLREARGRLYAGLVDTPGVDVYPSAANFLLVRITCGLSATAVAVSLLDCYHILVKDLTGKTGMPKGEYIRIAVRDDEDNAVLIQALGAILGGNNGE